MSWPPWRITLTCFGVGSFLPTTCCSKQVSTLTPRSREIVILRTAWLAGCAYEWGQHLKIATRDVAFGEAEFTALAEGAAAALWGPAEAALIQAADGLYRDAFVDDVTWNRSFLPILEKGEQFPRVSCIFALLRSHYKIS